jgi:hypothetical protein
MRSRVPEALIRCVSSGLSATSRDINALAKQIWMETAPSRSSYAWGDLEHSSPERQAAMRNAAIALNGCLIASAA